MSNEEVKVSEKVDWLVDLKQRLAFWMAVMGTDEKLLAHLGYQNDTMDKSQIILEYWDSLRKLFPNVQELIGLLMAEEARKKQLEKEVCKEGDFLIKKVLETLNVRLKELAQTIYENDPSHPKESQARVVYRLEKVLFKVLRALDGIMDNNLIPLKQNIDETFVTDFSRRYEPETSVSRLDSYQENQQVKNFVDHNGCFLISNPHTLYPGLIQHILLDPSRNQAVVPIPESGFTSTDLSKMLATADKLSSMGKIVFYNSPHGGASVDSLHFQVIDCEQNVEYPVKNRFLETVAAQDREQYCFDIDQFESVVSKLNIEGDSYNISFIGDGKFVVYMHLINGNEVRGNFWKNEIEMLPKLFEKGVVLSNDAKKSLRSLLLRIIAGPAGFEFTTVGLALNKTTIVNSILQFLLRLFPELEQLNIRSLIQEITNNENFFAECYTKNCRPILVSEFPGLEDESKVDKNKMF